MFRYECPICGPYEIRSVAGLSVASSAPVELSIDVRAEKDVRPDRDGRPLEMESAALEHWAKALDDAERHRRATSRTADPPERHKNSGASACA